MGVSSESIFSKISQKISNGARMVLTSFEVLSQHKKALFFALIKTTITILLICLWLYLLKEKFGFDVLNKATHNLLHDKLTKADKLTIAHTFFMIIFFFIFTINFIGKIISTILNVSLSYYVSSTFSGQKISVGKSFLLGLSNTWLAIKWAFAAVIMKMIINNLKNKGGGLISGIIASLLGSILQVGWFIISFFIIPVIAFENLGLIESIKSSANTMIKTFGETVVAAVSFSAISSIVGLVGFITVGGIVWTITFSTYTALAAGIAFVTIASCIISTTEVIFKTAVYNFATGKPTGPFKTKAIEKSFYQKQK